MNNNYILSFELLSEYNNIQPFKINFHNGLNIIIGDNGTGKSTMLRLMNSYSSLYKLDNFKLELSEHTIKNGVKTKYLDTEKQNPRIQELSGLDGDAYKQSLFSHFISHGESLLPILLHVGKCKNSIVFIDEPESGISLKNQYKIITELKKAEESNCQLFVVTHSYLIIDSVDIVFDMETKQWIKSKDYINSIIL